MRKITDGWDLHVLGCVLQLAGLSTIPCFALAAFFLRPDALLSILGVSMTAPFFFTICMAVLMQWLWWRRFREMHPMFFRRKGNIISGLVVLGVIAFAGFALLAREFQLW